MTKSLVSRRWSRLWPLLLLPVGWAAMAEPNSAAPPMVTHAVAGAAAGTAVASPPDPVRSAAAFRKVAEVLRHPRCLNCHPAGDFPRQGDLRTPHQMGVIRGADDHGVVGMRCATCHSDQNVDEVPGAPHWALAPLAMAWEGLSDAELADSLKDPARNGKRSLEQLYDHMANDALVGWAWEPGGSRLPPPISRAEFARLVREWIDTGAVSPAPEKQR
jgi:hypothetical protein